MKVDRVISSNFCSLLSGTIEITLLLKISRYFVRMQLLPPWRSCFCQSQLVGWLVGWLVGLLVCWLVGLLVCWLVGWFNGMLVGSTA